MHFKIRVGFRLILLRLMVLCCVGLILIYLYTYSELNLKGKYFLKQNIGTDNIKLCFQKWKNISGLLDNVLDAPIKPTPDHSIFFHETSCRMPSRFDSIYSWIKSVRVNLVNLTVRQACAVESAALHNPNSNIFVLFTSPASWFNDSSNEIMNAVLSYTNVHMRNLDMWRYAADTPINDWFRTEKLFSSRFVNAHMSDLLRFLTLWRYGGTYLDLDVVVLRSLEDLPPNFVGAESKNNIGSGVLNFATFGIGRIVADYCLQDFQTNFNGSLWGNNGPGVITRTLKHICQVNNVREMFDTKRCSGFKVFNETAFYAISTVNWKHFFEENQVKDTLERVNNSYSIHVWNRLSKNQKHLIGSPGAYGELASKNCPKVYASTGKYF